jgi:hypothetical protein
VLSLDEPLENTVNVLKKGALRLIGGGQFDEAAQFNEPSLELIIPQMT